MSNPSFMTQAVNFISTISGGVDPRTGLYNITFPFGKVIGNRGLGPVLPLTLRYSPLSVADYGLGIGCTLGFTMYQRVGGQNPTALFLSTGEQYPVSETGNTVSLKQQRLKNLSFTTKNDKNVGVIYQVAHKSGDLELLQQASTTCPPYSLVTPAGHALTLGWDTSGDYPKLQWVKDDTGVYLLQAKYADAGTTLHILPDNPKEGLRVDLDFTSRILKDIILTAPGCDPLTWTFYNDKPDQAGFWGLWLVGMLGPNGYYEKVSYTKSDGHKFPSGSPLPLLPYVYNYVRSPMGGQMDMTTKYEYSNTNFVGGYSGKNWDSYQDSLMDGEFDSQYKYWSTETRTYSADKTHDAVITRTYNAYHLQISEETSYHSGTSKRTVVSNYNIAPNATLDNQPASYQLPTNKTVTWELSGSPSTSETTQYQWDDYGNPILKIDPDGVVTTWEYYNENGESGLCPKAPHGFKRFAKSMQIDTTKAQTTYTDTPMQRSTFRYAGFTPVGGLIDDGFVLKNYEAHNSGGTLLSEVSFSYYSGSDNGGIAAGRLKERTTTHYPNDGSNQKYMTHEVFSYDDVQTPYPNGIKKTQTLTAHYQLSDALTVTQSKTRSIFTGRVWETVDTQGNTTHYDYDGLGRRISRTFDPNSDYENVLTYDYKIDSKGKTPFVMIQTDSKGNKIRYTMDAMRRVIQKDINDVDKDGVIQDNDRTPWYTQLIRTYDDLDRPSTSTALDQLEDGSANYSLTSTTTYDDWGQPNLVSFSDNTVEITTYDPIGDKLNGIYRPKASTTFNDSGQTVQIGTQVTTYDYHFSQKPIKVERYKKNSNTPYSTRTMTYDGLHRLRSETDELNHTTSYDYDDWHRLIKTTLPDGTLIMRSYSPDSSAKHVAEIKVQKPGDPNLSTPVSVGIRTFDGLGRVISKTVGGKKWIYHYDQPSSTKPTTVNTPDGVTQQYTYDHKLGEKLTSVSAGSINQSFGYDSPTGAIKNATTEQAVQQYNHYPSNRLSSDVLQWDGQSKSTAYTYSVGGILHQYTHIDGAVQAVKRYDNGRIKEISDNTMSVTPSYDTAGRLNGWAATDLTSQHTLTTSLLLDDFGRETNRNIVDNQTNTTWIISQVWNEVNLLTARLIMRNKQKVRIDQFLYNTRNQLTEVDYSGPNAPRDRFGNLIIKQQFTLDALGNVTQVVTLFGDQKGTTNTATFNYNYQKDPCQLVSIQNTHPSYPSLVQLDYDAAGRLLNDHLGGYTFTYDELGRVQHASSTLTELSGDYGYEAHNCLYKQSINGQTDPLYFYYRANQLVNLTQGSNSKRLLRSYAGCTSQSNTGENSGVWLMGTNNMGSILCASDGTTVQEHFYSAYGEENING